MELRRYKTLRWTLPIAKIALLQTLMIPISHAIELNDITSTSTDLPNDSLAQLDLDRDNRDENDHSDKLDRSLFGG